MIDLSRPHMETGHGLPPGTLPEFAPVPQRKARHDGWTPVRQRRFIEALADCGSVKSASKAVNMTFAGAYALRRRAGAEEFRAAWDAALALGVQQLEDVAMERALHGVEEDVWHNGKVVGARRVYNDKLLMFVLRNRAGSRFAADSIANAGAATRSYLQRLKKEWREEWEAEREKESAEVLESLNAKLERMARRHEEGRRLERESRGLCAGAAEEDDGDEGPGDDGPGDGGENEVKCAGAVAMGMEDARGPGEARILPHLLSEGDKGLGLPRGGIDPDARRAIAARREGKALVLPPSAEELAVAGWLRELRAREKMPGRTGVMGVRKEE